jgi:tryptophanyl-tRNA synthetase
LVPVGQDQKQHLEVTRDIAAKFNETFGATFRIPEAGIREETATMPGLDGQKMSKSYHNTIEIFAPEQEFRKKVMSIKTDSTPVAAPKPLEGSTILAMARGVVDAATISGMEESMRRGGTGYGEYKQQLFGWLWDYFAPLRTRRAELAATPGLIDQVLADGERQAREYALTVIARARQAVGIK